jgi:hypothetical protein
MNNDKKLISMRAGNFSIALFIVMLCASISSMAQGDGPRFYWKGLVGTNAVPVIGSSMGGNANPTDPSFAVVPGAEFQATMASAGYARFIKVFNRSGMLSVLVPMGRISSNVSAGGLNRAYSARGYGDPMLQMTVNIIGPKPIMNIPDMLRHEPKFTVDLIGSLAIPIGENDPESPVNIGQNRWYGRIGAPIVWQLGSWVPGRRTTLEFLPAVWLFGANNDFVGEKLTTDPMFQLEAHLTRDFMERFWGSLDVISMSGGQATIGGNEGNSLSNIGVGGTLGFQVNNNMQIMFSYSSTVNDRDPEDLNMDSFRLTFTYGWHKLIEGMHRLKSGGE